MKDVVPTHRAEREKLKEKAQWRNNNEVYRVMILQLLGVTSDVNLMSHAVISPVKFLCYRH